MGHYCFYNLQFTIFLSLLVCRLRHQPCAFFAFAASSSRSALFPVRRKQVDFLKNGSRGGIFAAFCEVGQMVKLLKLSGGFFNIVAISR